eukprot:6473460-Amphidinium_carterae.2
MLSQLGGELWRPMHDTLKLLSDVNALASCGIGAPVAYKVSVGDVIVHEEHQHVDCLARYILTLVAQRLKRLTWFTNGHLPDVVRIANGSEDDMATGVNNIRDAHESIAEARTKGKWWHDLAERT